MARLSVNGCMLGDAKICGAETKIRFNQERFCPKAIAEKNNRREKCDTQSLKEPKSSTAFHERPATASITATYDQQISINSNRAWNLVRDQVADLKEAL
jgi:hypothetical protein